MTQSPATPPVTTHAELVHAVRKLYRGTPHEHTWLVSKTQYAHQAAPRYEIWDGKATLAGDTAAEVLQLAQQALGLEPDAGEAP